MTVPDLLQLAVSFPEESVERSLYLHHARRLDLRERIMACTACALHETVNAPVPWEGHPALVAIIGEAPGAHEDRLGRPFVGAAGNVLSDVLHRAGFARPDVVLINSICCRPPSNDFELAVKADAPARCRPFLDEQIALSGAWILVPVGNRAMNAIIPEITSGITQARGIPRWRGRHLVLPTFHPAYALRNPREKESLLADLLKVRRIIEADLEVPVPKSYDPNALLSAIRQDTLSEDDCRRFATRFKVDGWVQAYSHWLDDKVILRRDDSVVVPPHVEGVCYTVRELVQLASWDRDWGAARRLHLAKREFEGVIV